MVPAMSVAFDWVDFQKAFCEAATAAGFSPNHLAERHHRSSNGVGTAK